MITNLFVYPNNPVSIKLCVGENIYNDVRSHARMIYVLSGTLSVQYQGRSYSITPDNLIYINPQTFHDIYGAESKFLMIHIEYSYYDKTVIPSIPYIDCNSTTEKENSEEYFDHIKNTIARFVQLSTLSENIDQIKGKSLSYELLSYLVSYFKVDSLSKTRIKTKNTLIEEILQFISDNYNTDITLSSLAEHFNFTSPYMSKLFKQEIGTTFLSYLQDIRLRYVKSDLSRRKMSAEELAEKHGFPNARSLLTCFKEKFGISFSEYKKSLTLVAESNEVSSSLDISSDLNILSKHLKSTPNLVINETKHSVIEIPNVSVKQQGARFNHCHSYQIGTGSARELLDPINQEMLREAIREIGYRYVAFHGLLDDDMMVYTENQMGEPIHSFWYIIRVIDFILSLGAKPIVELSFMPSALAADPKHRIFFKGACISLPKDYTRWNNLITDLFDTLCLFFGREEVESWPIQLWSVPDTTEKEFGIGPKEKYVEFYRNTVYAIRKVIDEPNIELPKLTDETLQNETIMGTLFEKLDAIYPPKAVNFGCYGIRKENVPSASAQTTRRLTISNSESFVDDEIQKIKGTLANLHKENLMFKVSEWNSSLSHRNLVNDTAYKAAYIVRNVLENQDEVDGFGYWTLFDTNETQPPEMNFHGGLGLYTRNGIKKSAYYGFWILTQLGHEIIAKGKGYAVFRKGKVIQVLLYNYHNINNLYSQGEMFDMSFTNRYTAFTQATDVKFLLTIDGIPDGEYELEKTTIDRENSSSYDKWVKMGAPNILDQEDMEYIKTMTAPHKRYRMGKASGNKLQLNQTLSPHEICLIEIK